MAEERRGYYNEALDQSANAENMGTPLRNLSDELLHIRQVDLTIFAEDININESAQLVATKSAARSESVGIGHLKMRVGVATGDNSAATAQDGAAVGQKSWVYPRGALTLETGEALHLHLTEVKDGGTYDCMMDVQFHY